MIGSNPESPSPRRLPVKVALWFSYLFLVIAACSGLLFLYWGMQSNRVLELHNTPFAVRPGTNQAGQVEFMHIDYCKKRAITGTVVAQMVGTKSVIRIPWPIDNSAPQCLNTDVPIPLPVYAADDTYYFNFIVTYKINILKKSVMTFRSGTFKIQSQSKMVQ
jgi:hypothetical protein